MPKAPTTAKVHHPKNFKKARRMAWYILKKIPQHLCRLRNPNPKALMVVKPKRRLIHSALVHQPNKFKKALRMALNPLKKNSVHLHPYYIEDLDGM
jgi:hypothetical protein